MKYYDTHRLVKSEDIVVEGFLTFVCVDEDGNKIPHNLVISYISKEDELLLAKISNFKK